MLLQKSLPKAAITAQIQHLLQEYQVQPLFYTEGGSRLYQTHHDESDYDARGIHLGKVSPKGYLGKQQGLLDFASFELDRFFTLLSQNNPNCIEWVQNAESYIDHFPERAALLRILERYFDPKVLKNQYLSLAENGISRFEKGKTTDYKSLFHIVRALLTANLITSVQLPPIHFETLLANNPDLPELQQLGQLCLDKKIKGLGKTLVQNSDIVSSLKEAYQKIHQKPVFANPLATELSAQLEVLFFKMKSRPSLPLQRNLAPSDI